MAEVSLAEQTHKFVAARKWEVAVLPFGATEPHGYHMPYGTDNFQVDAIGRRACGYAAERGANVVLLPTVPFGVNTNHLKVPGGLVVSVTPTTLLKILEDVVDSLERQGVKKLVLLNGHGGNELKPLVREFFHRRSVFVCVCDWYRVAAEKHREIFAATGEHADEMETSLGLAYFPQFMRMEAMGTGAVKPCRFEAVRKGWVSVVRPWHIAVPDTGVGDPKAASKEKGEKLMGLLEERIGGFLVELAGAEMDAGFPY
jgi:creatinine amidohydrolase